MKQEKENFFKRNWVSMVLGAAIGYFIGSQFSYEEIIAGQIVIESGKIWGAIGGGAVGGLVSDMYQHVRAGFRPS